ncbi:hypothetical protein ACQI4F_03880 [Mycolicibacterium vaccae]|uniref:hypothetical protein n=1 Tax=Mycolicibacterium vaccae TaxID=1810 RepID=UPI003CEDD492
MATFGLLVGGSIGIAGPATAQSDPVWVMPDVREMILARAVKDVASVAAPVELDFRFQDTKGPREVINLSNWTVCATSPSRGSRINPKTKRVIFAVKRAADDTCS